MVSLGHIYKCGKRRKWVLHCGSEVVAAKSMREVKLRASGVARRPRCCRSCEDGFKVYKGSLQEYIKSQNSWLLPTGMGWTPSGSRPAPPERLECEAIRTQRPPSTPGCEAVRAQRPPSAAGRTSMLLSLFLIILGFWMSVLDVP
ncbi:hypothetical protein LR48_Vigan01g077600 [Vigna angularis]|uniref:Uncharacterized protein n=1 Tax=Phaseolus angularis TaxID=3914 RepID=A0A0L9TL66_PHAAN|nr:hypothetical protein LR48_Vigan01g077600 [Vigna angularis]